MSEINTGWSRAERRFGSVMAIAVTLILVGIVAWGITHRPIRRRGGPVLPTIPAIQTPMAVAETPQPGGGPVLPTPTLGSNDVMVYTLDGREVCSGHLVGELGYSLQCGAPAGVHLFRIVDAAGESTLAVRYNEQFLVRVGPRRD